MSRSFGIVAIGALVLIGCPSRPQPPPGEQEPVGSVAGSVVSPVDELATLDGRVPVPLQPMMAWHQKQNMMDHLVAVQQITDGLAREDWDDVASAAARLGSSPEMQQMCGHMGAGADGFTEMALDFHRRADAIAEAARAHDGASVLNATSHTLQACTGCHAVFRQRVVDAATWKSATQR